LQQHIFDFFQMQGGCPILQPGQVRYLRQGLDGSGDRPSHVLFVYLHIHPHGEGEARPPTPFHYRHQLPRSIGCFAASVLVQVKEGVEGNGIRLRLRTDQCSSTIKIRVAFRKKIIGITEDIKLPSP
jgi:hypothetical protein